MTAAWRKNKGGRDEARECVSEKKEEKKSAWSTTDL